MDGWCRGILLVEWFKLYNELKYGDKANLEEPVPYSNYIEWLNKKDNEKAKEYWSKYLEGYTEAAVIPFKKNQNVKEFKNSEVVYKIQGDIVKRLEQVAKNNKVTINMLIKSIWSIQLQKYNNTNDVVFGYLVSGRNPEVEGIEKMIGLFINTIPLRVKLEENSTYRNLLANINKSFVENSSYEFYPLAKIQFDSEIKEELINNFMFFEEYPVDSDAINNEVLIRNNIKLTNADNKQQTQYDFNIVVEKDNDITIKFCFNENLYSVDDVKKISAHFNNIINQILYDENVLIKDIKLLTEDEEKHLLYDFNSICLEFPKDKMIYEIIEKNAVEYSNKIAIASGKETITYEELDKRSNRIANYLRDKMKNEFDNRVGIIMDRGIDLIVAILGIWKAGGAYVPIDTACPDERKRNIVKGGEIEIIISHKKYLKYLETLQEECKNLKTYLCIDDWCTLNKYSDKNIEDKPKQKANSLAYIIYTSGSTGVPKGAMVEHLGMLNHMYAKITDLNLNKDSIVAQNASYTFDISVWQMFSALMCGGKTVVYSNEDILNPEILLNKTIEDRVSILEVVPSYLRVIIEILQFKKVNFNHLKYVLVTGEELGINLVNRWFEINKNIKLVNAYGPTEASDDITHYIIENKCEFERVPIGKPIYNLNIYIVDKQMNLCPIGVKGEICVSGIGVGRGYFNDEEKTKKVFMKDVFKNDYKLYKTGDLGCWREDGTIDFFGRIDHQVKVRGFRIELGEIEKNLIKYDGIKDSIVIDKKDEKGNKFLCAYITADVKIQIEKLKEHLMGNLPYYMIPQQFIIVDEMPLTPNGKVDRKALANIKCEKSTNATQELPANELEEKLLKIFKDILSVEEIGVCGNFFELGGDSIKAIQVVSRLQKDNLKLDINDIFTKPTIRQLASNLGNMDIEVEQGVVTGEILMTPIQKWFFETKNTKINHFNQSLAIYGKYGFDQDAIKAVFTKIVEQHDVFRIIFDIKDTKIIQMNRGLEENLFDISVFELEEWEDIGNNIKLECDKLQRSLSLNEGKLIKLALFKTTKGDYLIIIVHHLIIDGISWRIVLDDLKEGYIQYINGKEIKLQEKTHSYQIWANKLKEYAQSEQVLNELEYWAGIENTQVDKISKDKDVQTQEKISKNFKKVIMKLDNTLTKQLLTDVNKTYNTEINDILISGLGMALKLWVDIDNIFVSMEGHGRETIIDGLLINRTVGWFTSQYPLLINTQEYENIGGYLKKTKDMIRKMPNKGIGYGILRYLTDDNRKHNVSLELEPEINFNYLGQFNEDSDEELFKIVGIEIGDLDNSVSVGRSESEELERNEAINVEGAIIDNELVMSFGYNSCEFEESNIERLAEIYKSSLVRIIQHCINSEESEVTLSDLTYSDLTSNELTEIEDYLKDIDL